MRHAIAITIPRKRSENSTIALSTLRCLRSGWLILDLNLRFEFFGEQCLRAGNNDAIAAAKAARHKPSTRRWTRHYELPPFELRRCDLHICPCAVASPNYCCFRKHDTGLASAGRLELG